MSGGGGAMSGGGGPRWGWGVGWGLCRLTDATAEMRR